jgi:hypothetical protein
MVTSLLKQTQTFIRNERLKHVTELSPTGLPTGTILAY